MTEAQAAWLIRGAMVAGGDAGVTDLLLAGGTITAVGPGWTTRAPACSTRPG